ncbi:hypothetical protein FNV43_RR25353 [Rhamnella rubrinervis]|uniref:PGG domain-containing protein n=1 Tax=Rhamnella rubrinervis TaxID=2594499 RepID=A0A8K0DUX6_9ROSA|nr:hypothetical protein FNV43_RR25353 [Rhamnella rubrinervis]
MNTELYNAAIYGRLDCVKFKASADDEKEITYGQNNTILHVAAKSGKLQIKEEDDHYLRFLYEQNKKGDTPLHIAAKMGHLDMTKDLVKNARKTDVEQGRKLLRMVNMEKDTALHEAVRGEHLEVVKLLLEEDKGLASLENGAGESPLFIAVDRCFFAVGFHILDTAPNCSFAGSNGMTVLHAAVIRSHSWKVYNFTGAVFIVIAEVLFGNRLQKPSDYRLVITKLTYRFSNNGPYLVVDYLLRYFRNLCDTNQRDIVDEVLETFQSKLIMEKADDSGWIPLHYAAYIGNKELVDQLLMNSSSNRSVAYTRNKQGMSALHLSAEKGHLDVITTLVEKCPEVCELLDDYDRTALHVAVECREKDVVDFFLQSLPFQDLVNQKDMYGNTALHLAASSAKMEDFKILTMLAHNPKVDKGAVNDAGMTFIDILQSKHKQYEFIASRLKGKFYLQSLLHTRSWESAMKIDQVLDASSSPTDQNQKSQDHGNGKNDMNKINLLICTIIATVSFAATVQVPGGYVSGEKKNNGLAVLRRHKYFNYFLIYDTLSFTFSVFSMAMMLFRAMFLKKSSVISNSLSRTLTFFTLISIISMMVAFMYGISAVLDEKPRLLDNTDKFIYERFAIILSGIFCGYVPFVLVYEIRILKRMISQPMRSLHNYIEALLLRLGFWTT